MKAILGDFIIFFYIIPLRKNYLSNNFENLTNLT